MIEPTDILGNIKLYNADCMDILRKTPDKYYSLSIVDPPFGIRQPKQGNLKGYNGRKSLEDRLKKNRLNAGVGKPQNGTLSTSNCEWDNAIPTDEYFDELFRVSKNQIIWGGNYFYLPPTRGIICWDKVQPWDNFSQIEYAWTSFNVPAKLFRFDNRTGDKIHPTQKPVQLYKWLLLNYAKEGDTILDTHFGSLSIGIACHDMKFDLTAIELDKDYYEQAKKRLQLHQRQLTLF
jgi:site-specific DNA-methyltransferase (adenine-specific)